MTDVSSRHTVHVPASLWRAARVKALDEGRTVSDVVRAALEDYVKEER